MGLFDGIRAWVRAALGREADGDTADSETTAEYRCGVCGTEVEDPDGECPLCRSTEVVTGDADDGDDVSATEHAVDADPATEATLREVLEDGPLDQHADRWERVEDGYRIERPGGGTERVDSRAEARAVLLRLYG